MGEVCHGGVVSSESEFVDICGIFNTSAELVTFYKLLKSVWGTG